MTKYMLTTLAAIIFPLTTSTSHAREIVDKKLGFRITIPDEFEEFPVPVGMERPTILYSFIRQSDTGENNVNIMIERMNGTIGRELLTVESLEPRQGELPPGSKLTIYKTQWKGHALTGSDMRMIEGGIPFIARSVQVPLSGEAIQITVGGPAAADTEITQVLEQMLGTLEGESNWDAGASEDDGFERRVTAIFNSLRYVAAVIALIVFLRIRRKKRRQQQYAASEALSSPPPISPDFRPPTEDE